MDSLSLLHRLLTFLGVYLSSSLAYWLRFNQLFLPIEYVISTSVFAIVFYIALGELGFFANRHRKRAKWLSNSTLSATIIATVATALILYLTKVGSEFSRLWFGFTILISMIVTLLTRKLLARLSDSLFGKTTIVILGGNQAAYDLKQKYSSKSANVFAIKHFATSSNELQSAINQTSEFIETHRSSKSSKHGVSEVWITQDIYEQFSKRDIFQWFSDSAVKVLFITQIPDSPASKTYFIDNFIVIDNSMNQASFASYLTKLVMDKTLSFIAIVLLTPFFLIIALMIRIDSPGPTFYRQQRYGLNGKAFKIWKFRTMSVTENEQQFTQATRNDSRVTKLGHFLRKYSIDELPQLFNVLDGSMSLVGPRPHPNMLNEQFREKLSDYMKRHTIKPGITGLAQVSGFRGETADDSDMQGRIDYDLEYINQWSINLDIRIIFKTLVLVFAGSAY